MENSINDNYINPVGPVPEPTDALANVKKNIWINLDDVEMTDDINQIHCDTRDFHCLIKQDVIDVRDGREPEIRKSLHRKDVVISKDEVIPWLKSLKEMAGGNANWRYLLFDNVECDGWLKYIRMYRHPKKNDLFIVCNNHNKPIQWQNCTKENLNTEMLDAY